MRDIVIWGTGTIGRRLYYQILRGGVLDYNVKYFIDNAKINKFYDCEVVRPTRENCSKYLIVIASNIYYKEIAGQLTDFGLIELKDFIPYQALGRKIVLLHGNCHIRIITEYLNTSSSFKESYYIYPIPLIQHNKLGYIKDCLLENCDVFVCQDVQENNAYDYRLSVEYCTRKVRGKKICIPNVFGLGGMFFPQAESGYNDELWCNHRGIELKSGLFIYRDTNIDNLWKAGQRNINEIARTLEGYVYDVDYVKRNFKKYMNKYKEREKFWDVKIMDYIESNYQEQQMFYDRAHPCNNILKIISEGILGILEIDVNEIRDIDGSLNSHEIPIYPCVREALGLKFAKEYIREYESMDREKLTQKMDLEEYCREYCYWCYGYIEK